MSNNSKFYGEIVTHKASQIIKKEILPQNNDFRINNDIGHNFY